MKARNFAAMVMAVVLAAALGGCAAESSTQVNVNPSSAQNANDLTELTFFAPVDISSISARYYRSLIDRFNDEHPDVHVVLDGVSTGDGYNQFLEDRLDVGQGDDVFIVNADTVKSLYEKGHFYDMSTFPSFERLIDAARTQSTIGDIAYCLPLSMNAYSMLVNTDVLKNHELEVPTNLEEFTHCCEVLKAAGETPIALNRWYALTVPAMANGLLDIYGSDDSHALVQKMNSGEVKVGDVMRPGLSLVESMIDSGWYGDGLTTEAVDVIKAGDQDIPDFATGNAAFMFVPAQAYEKVVSSNPAVNFVITGVPVPNGMVTLPAVGARLCINAGGDELELAKEFVEYLTSEEMEAEQDGRQGLLPIFQGQTTNLDERMHPMLKVYEEEVQIPIEDMNLYFTYWDTVRELCIKMFDGYTAEQAVVDYNALQDDAIAKK